MLERLRQAAPGRVEVATPMPPDSRSRTRRSPAGYCRLVLHLVAGWREVVRELCCAVRPGGVVGWSPEATPADGAVWLRLSMRSAGGRAVGLTLAAVLRTSTRCSRLVAPPTASDETPMQLDSSLDRFLGEAAARTYPWTWRAGMRSSREPSPTCARERSSGTVRPRNCFADAPSWRVYDLRT
jgi:hypothetical protein